MRHRNHSLRLGRKPDQARSILKNLATSILLYERVRTTKKRALVVRGLVDRIITIGKKDRTDLAIRKISTMTTDDNASRKVLEVYKKRYAARPSGFTRIVPVGMRKGDGALMADIILVDADFSEAPAAIEKEKPKKEAKKTSASKKSAK
jgi:large subunit ribosomal protein L17